MPPRLVNHRSFQQRAQSSSPRHGGNDYFAGEKHNGNGGIQVAVRILIVDDHDVVRRGIYAILLKSRPGWEICGEATNGKEAIDAVAALRPDVLILDITMPVMSGLEAASHIARLGLPCRVLIFTMHESESLTADVRKAGAHGCVQKSRAARDLILAIEALLDGKTFFGSAAVPAPQSEPKSNTAFFWSIEPAGT